VLNGILNGQRGRMSRLVDILIILGVAVVVAVVVDVSGGSFAGYLRVYTLKVGNHILSSTRSCIPESAVLSVN
jgi:hypothetical protein